MRLGRCVSTLHIGFCRVCRSLRLRKGVVSTHTVIGHCRKGSRAFGALCGMFGRRGSGYQGLVKASCTSVAMEHCSGYLGCLVRLIGQSCGMSSVLLHRMGKRLMHGFSLCLGARGRYTRGAIVQCVGYFGGIVGLTVTGR